MNMKVGDMVRNKNSEVEEFGLFMGTAKLKSADNIRGNRIIEVAEVMWFNRSGSYGDRICTIYPDSIEVING
jgi:hypothetical protein